jgi:ariadne-1
MSELNLKKKSSKVKSGSDNFNDYQDYDYDYDEYEEEIANTITDEAINFISESDILSEREKMILEATEKLFLERNQAILAMIYYKWNIDNLDNWYEDVDQNKVNAGIELSPKKIEEFKQKGIESFGDTCLVCFEEKNDDFYSLSCGHQFCAGCWEEYLTEKLKTPLGALQVKCQQEGCTCIVPEETYKKFIKDKTLLEKLDKAISKNFINRNEDLRQCPNPHCHLYAKSNMHSAREIKCKCGTSYCFKCSKESHRPCTCEMFEKWQNLNNNSKNDEKWILANTKECPHCHQKIEKSQGCNYMLCDKRVGGCGHAFCYVCETDWAKHSQDHFNCNKYTDAVKNKENNAKKIKEQLKRYDFYYSRFIDNEKAVEIVDKKLREDIGEKLNILVTLKNLSIMETQFIIDALETVINGKRLLKNTYIFGYYMKDNDKKDYFEHEQGILQYWTEELHRNLIDNKLNEIIKADNFQNFSETLKNYKNTLNNIISSIQKYSKGLIDDIENNFISEIDNKIYDEKLN